MKYTIEHQNDGGLNITLENGCSVMIYPDVRRDERKATVVNVCNNTRCIASVVMKEDDTNDVFNFE